MTLAAVFSLATAVAPPAAIAAAFPVNTSVAVTRQLTKGGVGSPNPKREATTLMPEEQRVVNIFQQATPSVVYVTNLQVRRDGFTLNETEVPRGTGSGFVWDGEGHIVTNFHVIAGASDLRVTLGDQSVYEAKVVGFDEDKDVAVLKIDSEKKTPAALALGRSASLLTGQRVFAIGNPFGLDHTLTMGVISGVGREIQSGNTGRPIRGVIQTDAAINPGNSGGPLLDSGGRVIGINTAIYSPSGTSAGVGFAIPVDTVAGIVDQIVRTGKVTRPVMGVTIAPDGAFSELGIKGVLVLTAPKEGPAGRAGIRSTSRDDYGRVILGDIIVAINDEEVRDSSDLYRIIDDLQVGDRARVKVQQYSGETRETVVVLGSKTTQFKGGGFSQTSSSQG